MPELTDSATRHTELVDQAVARLSPRWTTWTLQTIQQHGPMRLADINSALPWVGVHAMAQIVRRMQASNLLDRPQVGVYDLTPVGRDTQHVHRALSAWHRTHLTDRTASLAEAERVEGALGRLRGKGTIPLSSTPSPSTVPCPTVRYERKPGSPPAPSTTASRSSRPTSSSPARAPSPAEAPSTP